MNRDTIAYYATAAIWCLYWVILLHGVTMIGTPRTDPVHSGENWLLTVGAVVNAYLFGKYSNRTR
jgi:drug/metabolite transporter (DMT)-like permease